MASSREEGMSSTLRYASTVDTFLPAVTGAEPSLLLSARMVSWLAFSSRSSWFSFCFFLQHQFQCRPSIFVLTLYAPGVMSCITRVSGCSTVHVLC